MIEPKKRPGDMAVIPTAMKRPRNELVAAAQSQQLVATVRTGSTFTIKYHKSEKIYPKKSCPVLVKRNAFINIVY